MPYAHTVSFAVRQPRVVHRPGGQSALVTSRPLSILKTMNSLCKHSLLVALLFMGTSCCVLPISTAPRPVLGWTRMFGTPEQENVSGLSLTSDRGSITLGDTAGNLASTSSATLDSSIFVVKHDANGNESWRRQLGAKGGLRGVKMAADKRDDIFILGRGSDSHWIFALDARGNERWRKPVDLQENSSLAAPRVGRGYYVIGSTGTSKGTHFVSSNDADGKSRWTVTLDEFPVSNERPLSLACALPDGSLAIASVCMGLKNESTLFAARIAADGRVIWTWRDDHKANLHPRSLVAGLNNELYLVGTTEKESDKTECRIVALSASGRRIGATQLEGAGLPQGWRAAVDCRGRLYVAGTITFPPSELFLAAFSSELKELWRETLSDHDEHVFVGGLCIDGDQLFIAGDINRPWHGQPYSGKRDAFIVNYRLK